MTKKSLASETNAAVVESNPGAGLPVAFLQDTAIEVAAPIFQGTPYVSFVSSRGSGYVRLSSILPDLEEGSPVLILPQPEKPVLLDPFRYYLVASKYHYSEVDNRGEIVRSTFDRDKAKGDRQLLEHVEAIILVVLSDRIVPATCTFKTTKLSGIQPAIEAFTTASTPEWGALSAEHKASLIVPDPRFRFVTTVRMRPGTSRSTGNNYIAAQGIVRPTGAADWKAIADWLKDQANRERVTAVKARFSRRLQEVASRG